MVQATQYGVGHDLAAVRQRFRRAGDRLRDALMRSGIIEVADVFVRPCGVEVSTSIERYHWSRVIKAASYRYAQAYGETSIRKAWGDKSMM